MHKTTLNYHFYIKFFMKYLETALLILDTLLIEN